ncbi:MAG: biopolymer transporter ExbD [Candidatus Omnitrophica bacterium]|nr:biopolymer transporter ExbD [Candidatus Omnitrophota bacterium]
MDLRRLFKMIGTGGLDLAPLANIVFLLLLFVAAGPLFTGMSPLKVRLPGAVTSEAANADNITVVISSENIFYFRNKVVTLGELGAFLARPENKGRPVLIKADRRASVGRIVDLWNLGRGLGVERIDVASDRED